MFDSITGNFFLVLTVLVFIAVVLLLDGLHMLWKTYKGPEAKKIEKRLRALSASSDHSAQASVLKARMLSDVPMLERLLLKIPRASALDRFILQAGLEWTVSKLLLTSAVLGGIGFMVITSLAHQPFMIGAIAGAFTAALPLLYVQRKLRARLMKIEQQLPDALDLMGRALRAGHAFSSGLQMAGEEMAEPIANEFRIVHDEVNFGVALHQALTNLSERVPITDLRYFVVAVLIQRDSGGNLTEILGNLSRLIRDRLKLLSKVKALSAEGRMSAWVLGLMPFVVAGAINLINPGFMSVLWTDPMGPKIIYAMLIAMAVGAVWMRKIIRIHV